jgi:alpha-D-ribose 1-methylphosphonate 5-phosphate C-P lyase
MHALEDYGLMHVKLYEDIARHGHIATTYAYPVKVEDRYVMDPSPTPKFDNPKMTMSRRCSCSARAGKSGSTRSRPTPKVVSLDFEDHPFEIQQFDTALRALRRPTAISTRSSR